MKCKMFVLIVSFAIFSCGENEKKGNSGNSLQPNSIDNLTTLVRQNPDSAGLRMRLINSLDSGNMYKEAIAQTDSLIKKDSLNNGLWFTKARLQEDNKDTSEAIRSYTRAINIYPSTEAQLSIANLFAETKNPKALLISNSVKKLNISRETDANCDFIAGVFYARTGENKQALQMFDEAVNENYTLMEAYMEKGFIYYDSKKFADALKVFETAITVNNTYADAYYWKAKCEETMGNKAEAILNYKRASVLDKKLKEAADAVKRLEAGSEQ